MRRVTRVLRARALCPSSKMDARPVRVWNFSAPTSWTQAVVEQRARPLMAPSGEEAARKLVRRATTGVGPSDGAVIPLGAALGELRVSVRAVAKKRMQAHANEIYFTVMQKRLSNPAYPRYTAAPGTQEATHYHFLRDQKNFFRGNNGGILWLTGMPSHTATL